MILSAGLKKIAAIAEAHSIGMAPHNPNGPVATIMNLHYDAAIPNIFILETIGSEADEKLTAQMLKNPAKFAV
jgi:galactonate dehydratase